MTLLFQICCPDLFRCFDIICLHRHGTDTVTVPRPYATYLVDGKSYKTNDADIKLSTGEDIS